jgi:hypothetical protein
MRQQALGIGLMQGRRDMGLPGWGEVVGKVSSWFPTRRESLINTIDKIKKEMVDVQNKVPFDSAKYQLLCDKLRNAENLEKRAS